MPIRAVMDWAVELGVPIESPLAEAGLAPESLHDPWGRVEATSLPGLLGALERHSGDVCVGLHAGQHLSVQAYELCGMAFLTQPTPLGAALEAARLYNTFTAVGQVHVWQQEDTVWVQVSNLPAQLPGAQQLGDFLLSQMAGLVALCSEDRVMPGKMWSPSRNSGQQASYEAQFQDQVRFEQPVAMLAFCADQMCANNPSADPERFAVVRRYLDAQCAGLTPHTALAHQVQTAIRSDLRSGFAPTLPNVARRLGVSTRTLQDHLQREQTSYATCLDDIRSVLVLPQLAHPAATLDSAAGALGFDNVASLHRFTQRRFGNTPGQLRRHLQLPN